ncbi:YIP1 family protein [Candidatus Woesearchaeota archaeon]|nr:YIP1 family protein [Candidatus Woesearchaeota archaeon]
MIEKIKKLLNNPDKFFDKLVKENDIVEHLKFYLILAAFYTFFFGIYYAGDITETTVSMGFLIISIVLMMVFIYIMNTAWIFINSAIFYLFLLLFQPKGNYQKTFNVFVYSYVPVLVFFPFIFIIGILTMLIPQTTIVMIIDIVLVLIMLGILIYTIYLNLLGQSKAHKIEKWKVFVAGYVIPFVIFFVLALLLTFFIIGLSSLFSTAI